MKNVPEKAPRKSAQDRLLSKLSLFTFDRYRTMAILWLCVTIFGVVSYTTLLKREGFPTVNLPISIVSGAYLVNDAARVDKEVTKPISEIILQDDRVTTVQAQARSTFYSVMVQYKSNVDANQARKDIEQRIKDSGVLPAQATVTTQNPKFGFTERGDDAVISLYSSRKDMSVQDLTTQAERVVAFIESKKLSGVDKISVIPLAIDGLDPMSGKKMSAQTRFDRYGMRTGGVATFYDSVAIGATQRPGTDVIKFDAQLRAAIADYDRQNDASNYRLAVSAGYAGDIKEQISELQRALLEGLMAILVIGSLVIAIRASVITVLSMLTVLAITIGVVYVIGYSLNTITLFALVLCLGLIVDDTIIMVEAIDAQRRRQKTAREAVKVATRKVSRAMVAATSTAVLSFAPLLFVSGVLGSFIRAIPVTVITSLLVSLVVALIFIPLFARYILLGRKQMGAHQAREPAAAFEAKIAAFIGKPMLWARDSRRKLFAVGLTAVLIGFGFISAGGYLFSKVTFNIFPPSKDTNALTVRMNFAPGTKISEAEAIADKANVILADTLGENLKSASYFANAGAQNANLTTYITHYSERDVTAPELVAQLDEKFQKFKGAKIEVVLLDVGPPPAAFSVHIQTDDRKIAFRLAQDISEFLRKTELVRPSGEKAQVKEVSVADPGVYTRSEGKPYIDVTATFAANDTTTLVTLAQAAVDKEFTTEKLRSYGLDETALQYDFGQEDENQESFKTLALAFPLLLFVIYLLLAVQFRSLAQPLLIFMAIPFSLFGITLGLYLTENAFSFFAMLGFFALIGLSIKNTILLTDYANQLRRDGESAVDAAVGALAERFRPLVATSLTAAVSMIPLAVTSPFWEGLAVVLIFGLLSSTFLVITVFPYYYLGGEFIRTRVSRKAALGSLAIAIAAGVLAITLR